MPITNWCYARKQITNMLTEHHPKGYFSLHIHVPAGHSLNTAARRTTHAFWGGIEHKVHPPYHSVKEQFFFVLVVFLALSLDSKYSHFRLLPQTGGCEFVDVFWREVFPSQNLSRALIPLVLNYFRRFSACCYFLYLIFMIFSWGQLVYRHNRFVTLHMCSNPIQ